MYSDAHLHLNERMRNILQKQPISAVISCSTADQCKEAALFIQSRPSMNMSCGIHPWNADRMSWEELLPWIETSTIIGEIGMDNVWCSVNLQIQKQVFEKQLAYASNMHKPVVLHTKGMEKEILALIQSYPNTYHVHWYSCSSYIEEYRALDCYFSIGPFPSIDPNVRKVVERIPLNRLMIETDGISAIEWALDHEIDDDEYLSCLHRIASEIAEIKGKKPEEIIAIAQQNLLQFISVPKIK